MQVKFTKEFSPESTPEKIKAFESIDWDSTPRDKALDEFILTLEATNIDSDELHRYRQKVKVLNILLVAFAVTLIGVGVFGIAYPLPKYLEIKTLFYFNPDDGVTVSDLICAVLILIGIYIFAKSTGKLKI